MLKLYKDENINLVYGSKNLTVDGLNKIYKMKENSLTKSIQR